MTKFDHSSWREKALGRYEAAKGRDQDYPISRDLSSIASLELVIEWCDARRLKVDFVTSGGEFYIPDEKRITISSRSKPETQLFSLLHECGHYLFHSCSKNSKRFSSAQKGPFAGPTKDSSYRVNSIEEEYEAWHRGAKLASRLGIDYDQERFNTSKVACIKSYYKWALKLDGFCIEE